MENKKQEERYEEQDRWFKELTWRKNATEAINKENRWQKKFPRGEYTVNPHKMEKVNYFYLTL